MEPAPFRGAGTDTLTHSPTFAQTLGVRLVSPTRGTFNDFPAQSAIRIAGLCVPAISGARAAHHNPLQFQCFSADPARIAGLAVMAGRFAASALHTCAML